MYHKRSISDAQLKLQSRISRLHHVEPDFDLGNGLDKATLNAFVDEMSNLLEEYNIMLASADSLRDVLDTAERKANDVSERLLASVVATYGRDSEQYQQMGGTRKSKIDYSGSRPVAYTPENGAAGTDGAGT